MIGHQSSSIPTTSSLKPWPLSIRHTNIFTNESVILTFYHEQANGKATYREPKGVLYSNIPFSVAKQTKRDDEQ